tara:strand:+ start:8640 stop:8855 length:216 start_codon:yes stop_codon:yes gene_type:complete
MIDQSTCYSDGAIGVSIDYNRAHRELSRHSLDSWEDLQDFNRECWDVYSAPASADHPATIPASKVLAWLGY